MRKGITLPNRAYDYYTQAELDALNELRPNTLLWLLYGGAVDLQHQKQLEPYLLAHDPHILYRPYADNILLLSPLQWADICYQRINALAWEGELIPANECNLAVEHGNENWQYQIDWLTTFVHSWHKRTPMLVHLPALSPSRNYIAGWDAYLAAQLYTLFDVVDLHCYNWTQLHEALDVWEYFGKPLALTEFNKMIPSEVFNYSDKLTDCVWFLLGGTLDQKQYDLMQFPIEFQSFKEGTVPAPTPAPLPTHYEVGQGLRDLMTKNGDTPQSDEHYMTDAKGVVFKSEAFGAKGLYTWNKSNNTSYMYPFK